MRKRLVYIKDLIYIIFIAVFLLTPPCYAETPEKISTKALSLEFLSRIKKGFAEADKFMKKTNIQKGKIDLRGMPEGEILILSLTIPPRLLVEGAVFGEVRNNTVVISLKDFITILNLPIEYNDDTREFSGWFIREDKTFQLNLNNPVIFSDGRNYTLSNKAVLQDEDVLVPISDIELWFNTDIDTDLSSQKLSLYPAHPFPATERHERRNNDIRSTKLAPPSMPRHLDQYDLIDFPVVDVNTRTNFRRPAEGESDTRQSLNIRTAGEFAYGALMSNLSLDNENNLSSVRLSYLQESADPEILGPLKARRFEMGDITPTSIPIIGGASPEMGVRVTNVDPLVNLTQATTKVEGYFFPNWDVELYRENSLIEFKETDEEGYYSFENVPLLSDRNLFRLVAYGPQGEVREETINVPYDRNRLSEEGSGGAYDVSFTIQDKQTYQKQESQSPDKDTYHIAGLYELPVLENSALRLGARYRQEQGKDKLYASAGVSTAYKGAQVNAQIATDEKGELRSELSAIRPFGPHRARVDLDLSTDGYDPGQTSSVVRILSNRYNIEGPAPFNIGDNLRYGGQLQLQPRFRRHHEPKRRTQFKHSIQKHRGKPNSKLQQF